MLYIISLLIAALAAMVLAVASVRRPLICCPAAGGAAGVLLTVGGVLAVHGAYWWAVAAVWPGLVCGVWGGWHAFVSAHRGRAAEDARERALARFPFIADERDDLVGHTITVERVDRETARAWIGIVRDDWEGLIGRRAVVERSDGRLFKVCAIEGVEGISGAEIFRAARGAAHSYRAEYVPVSPDSSSNVLADLAVDNILGGGR